MPVVQISSTLPPLIRGGTSSLFSDSISTLSPPTRRRRRTPLFDDDDDDEAQDTSIADKSGAAAAAAPGASTSTGAAATAVVKEEYGDESAETLGILSARSGPSSTGRTERFNSFGSLTASSDPESSGFDDAASSRFRRSSLVGPRHGASLSSSSSGTSVSRSSSLRIVSRASGSRAGSSLVDHIVEQEKKDDEQAQHTAAGLGSSQVGQGNRSQPRRPSSLKSSSPLRRQSFGDDEQAQVKDAQASTTPTNLSTSDAGQSSPPRHQRPTLDAVLPAPGVSSPKVFGTPTITASPASESVLSGSEDRPGLPYSPADRGTDSSTLDFRRPSHALQIPIIKDALPHVSMPASSSSSIPQSTQQQKAPVAAELELPQISNNLQRVSSRSPRRYSDRVRPSPPVEAQEEGTERRIRPQRIELSLSTGDVRGSQSLASAPVLDIQMGRASTSAGLGAPLFATSAESVPEPSTLSGAAVSGASQAYGYGSQLHHGHFQGLGDAYGEAHLPRRHSGIFLQRTRSALSIGRRPDMHTSFGGGGHAHKGSARKASNNQSEAGMLNEDELRRRQQTAYWASAPFSALEERNRALAAAQEATQSAGGRAPPAWQSLNNQGSDSGHPTRNNARNLMSAVSQPGSPRMTPLAHSPVPMLSPSILRSGFIGGFNFTPLPAPVSGVEPAKPRGSDPGAEASRLGRESGIGPGLVGTTVSLGTLPARKGPISTAAAVVDSEAGVRLPDSGAAAAAAAARSIPPSRRSSRLALPPLEERRAITPDEIIAAQVGATGEAVFGLAAPGGIVSSDPEASSAPLAAPAAAAVPTHPDNGLASLNMTPVVGSTSAFAPTSAGLLESSALNRPALARAMTNVQYTPTTEEWSRFLASQGVGVSAPANASPAGAASGAAAAAPGGGHRGRTRSSRVAGQDVGSGVTSMSASMTSLRSSAVGEESGDRGMDRSSASQIQHHHHHHPTAGSERLASLTFSTPSTSSSSSSKGISEPLSPTSPPRLLSGEESVSGKVAGGSGRNSMDVTLGSTLGGAYSLRSPFEMGIDRFAGDGVAGGDGTEQQTGLDGLEHSSPAAQQMAATGVMERIKALSRTWSASAISSVLPHDLARSLLGTVEADRGQNQGTAEERFDDDEPAAVSGAPAGSALPGTGTSGGSGQEDTYLRRLAQHVASESTSTSTSSLNSDDDEALHALQEAVSRSPSVSGRNNSGSLAGLINAAAAAAAADGGAMHSRAGPHHGLTSPLPIPTSGHGVSRLSASPELSSDGAGRSPVYLSVPASPNRESEGRVGDVAADLNRKAHAEMISSVQILPHAPLPVGQGGPGTTRSIADFVVVDEIGRGAYGLVKKVRLRGPDGRPIGEPYIIKFIIKSRILADCWRRHKTLGPIPIEIHVLDQLRRIPFSAPEVGDEPPWAPSRLFGQAPGHTAKEQEARVPSSRPTRDPKLLADDRVRNSSLASHPALCEMMEFFEDDEFYYLVMPCFGQGQDLFDFVEAAPEGLPSAHVRSILGQVADALRHLHANNIVHRDIKDENVILDGEGNVQLIDFGSAAHVRPGRLFDTFSGTLDYAAAEILRGEKYGGKEQDVWALGVVAYVLLCGETPFWNGEEAIEGLAEGTRAAEALRDRCELHLHHHHHHHEDHDHDADNKLSSASMMSAVEQHQQSPAWSEGLRLVGEAADDDQSGTVVDLDDGQADGGGRVRDGADLICQCLQLRLDERPTAEQVCSHRFLIGSEGWFGVCGWATARRS
ncbi:serine/threonine protein kinase [Tilletia horrida]|nr:serine/threonine protein kinase [Tilletia horrida]KAK0562438.1 serine/threonine protein kinase [Tilletia horrida]